MDFTSTIESFFHLSALLHYGDLILLWSQLGDFQGIQLDSPLLCFSFQDGMDFYEEYKIKTQAITCICYTTLPVRWWKYSRRGSKPVVACVGW